MPKMSGRTCGPVVVAILALGAQAALAQATRPVDDVDRLLQKVQPPARFKDYKPAWSVKETTFTFQDLDGPVTTPAYLVMDGDRCVAYIPRQLFQGGSIFVQDFRPGEAPREPRVPTERLHIETETGAHIRSDAFIPSDVGQKPESYDFKVDGDRLVLTRRFEGESVFNKWSHRTKTPVKVKATNTAVFRVDPVLGYVVECTYDVWTDQKLDKFEFASAAPSGRHVTWAGEESCYRIAYSPEGRDGFTGFATNMGCTQQHRDDMICRDNGLAAFLNDRTGWSPTYTNNSGTTTKFVVCGPHTDLDFTLQMPKIAREKKDGLTHYVVQHRMLALPPEATRHVWDTMTVQHVGERKVLLQMGVVDDMEGQPLPLDGRLRGHTVEAAVSTAEAHSGKQSLALAKSATVGSPTLCVKPNTRYRLEGWMKAVPTDAAKPFKAGVSVGYQEWPGGRKSGEPMVALVSKAGEWEKITLEFTAPAWGPSLDLVFVADNATVYLDDFGLVAVPK